MKNRSPLTSRHSPLLSTIEPLESRIAPALLVVVGTDLTVSESISADDNLTFTADATNFHFANPNGIIAGNGAVQVDTSHVDVPVASLAGSIIIDTGNGNDAVTLGQGLPTLLGLQVHTRIINPGVPLPALSTGAGGLVLDLDAPVLITESITQDGSSVVISAPVIGLGPTGKINGINTAGIFLNADVLDIAPTARIQTDGLIKISTFAAQTAVDIGGLDRPGVLGLTNDELNTLVAPVVQIGTEASPITVTTQVIFATATNLSLTAGGSGSVIFQGASSINTSGGTCVLQGNGIVSGTAANDVTASSVNFGPGVLGVGTSTNPFTANTLAIQGTSFGAVKMFINANNAGGTVSIIGFNSTGAALTLDGGNYVLSNTNTINQISLTVNSSLDLNGTSQNIAALSGAGQVKNTDSANSSNFNIITQEFDGNFSGVLSGLIRFGKSGQGSQILTGTNTFTGTVRISGGTLQIDSDEALGNPNNVVVMTDGQLKTTGKFEIARTIFADASAGTPTINVASGRLVLTNSVVGTLQKVGPGALVFGPNFTGQAPFSPNHAPFVVGDTKVTATGAGNIIITIVPDPINGGTRISALELENTKANSVISIRSPTPITIDRIVSFDPADTIGTIRLGKNITLGNGVNDLIPDLDIHGRVKKLFLNDIAAFTRFELGKGLAYLDTYNNRPLLTMHDILGTGVVIDTTGNGIAGDQPGTLGGGGLGKVTVNRWSDPGIIQTSQSVTSFKLKTGDCFVTFSLDPTHLGAATIANIGQMTVVNGSWGSSGSVIEGSVGSFSASAFLESADISAASMKKLAVKKGDYAGTTTLTDPNAKALGTFSVNGDYLGLVNAAEGVINVNIKGDFKGSLSAQFIGSVSAYSFDGTKPTPGERQQIIATTGSLGTLKTSVRGIKNLEIDANTVFNGFNIGWRGAPSGAVGIDNVTVAVGQINQITVKITPQGGATGIVGIQNSIFESAGSIGPITSSHSVNGSMFAATTNLGNVTIKGDLTGSKLLAGTSLGGDGTLGGMAADQFTPGGSIGNVTVLGKFAATTIAAGIDPGSGLIYGDGDDIVGTSPLVTGPSKIGTISFGSLSGTMGSSSGDPHSDAIEAASIKSLKVGTAAAIKDFLSTRYLDTNGNGEDLADVLVKLV